MNIFKLIGFLLFAVFSFNLSAEEAAKQAEMTVYRSPTCGCCGNWIEHAEQNGFKVNDVVTTDMDAIKKKYGIPDKLASCHTTILDGYVIEGHVPAGDIQKLLQAKPKVLGLSAPGMPMGSPGMETGGQTQDYKVMSFDKDGKVEVFAEHGAGK
ncbi:MAG: DUF411 domain-containing protein [Methylomonas sp.]